MKKIIPFALAIAVLFICAAFASADFLPGDSEVEAVDPNTAFPPGDSEIEAVDPDTAFPPGDSAVEAVNPGTAFPPGDSAVETADPDTAFPPGDSATETVDSGTGIHDQKIDGTLNPDILRVSHLGIDQIATSNGTSSWYDYFDTTDENPTYYVWIDNTGDSSIQAVVKRGDFSDNDNMIDPVTIVPGEQYTLEMTTGNEGNSPGRRWVVINPVSGNAFEANAFEANVQVRILPSFGEVG